MTTSSYHHGDLRTALLKASGEILEEQGLATLSLREAARRAGVSHNAPYRHFPDRNSLLAALAAEGFGLLDQAVRKRPEGDMGLGYVEFALAHPQRFRLMFGGQLRFDDYPELRAQAEGTYSNLQRVFADLGADAAFAAAAAWSLVHGLANLMLDGHFARGQSESGGASAFAKKVLGSVRLARAAQRST
jgi:AcrR family transcriptional regulator